MSTYKLTINVDSAWIQQFNEGGMKLCFASAVESGGGTKYNVVAFADSKFRPIRYSGCAFLTEYKPAVADTVTIEWQEEYKIAASKTKFADGGM